MTKIYTNYDFLTLNRVLGLPVTPRQLDEAPSLEYVLSLLSNPTVIGKTGDYLAVQAVATSELPLSGTATANPSGNRELTIGGVPVTDGRVLLSSQTNPAENGLYTVTIDQVTGAYTLTRTNDANEVSEFVENNRVFVLGGSLGSSFWILTNPVTTLGTDPITFVQSTTANNVDPGLTQTQKFAANIVGDGMSNQFAVIHNLGTLDLSVSVKIPGSAGVAGEFVSVDILDKLDNGVPDINSTRISFAHPPAIGDTFRVIVIG